MRKLFHHPSKSVLPCLFFIVLIWLPILDLALKLDPTPALVEKRRLTERPSLRAPAVAILQDPTSALAWTEFSDSVTRYPQAFTLYFDDHFGFRRLLVRLYGRFVLLGWPTESSVIPGQHGWLFGGDWRIKESYQASSLFSVEELGNWLNELERRRDWLAGQGCDYLLVIVPEKSTIYPELMPANVPRFGQKTRLDQLVAYVEDNSDLQILDLREALLLGRSQRETYYRTDTHWNGWGAFIASERILLRLAERHPGIRPYAETDYWFREQERSGGDLARLLALGDVLTDQRILAVLRVPTRAGEAPTGVAPEPNLGPWGQPQAWESSLEDAPTVVVFSDSFGAALVPFLSEHFRRSLYLVRFGVDETVILRERPDIVVQELAERELQRAAPPNDIVELAYE